VGARQGAILSMAKEPRGSAAATQKRKLIEVALPLEAINREASRDGPKRKNHPWRLHYWWARRKLSIARAVLRRPVLASGSVPDRGGPGCRARTAAQADRTPCRLGEHPGRGAAGRSPRGDFRLDRRQPATDPRPVRRGRLDPARGPAPRARGPRFGPQPRRRADQQGTDRDPVQLR
jgi:uncharacterized protein DUF1156